MLKVKKMLISLLSIFTTAYLIFGAFLYLKQRDFLYFPTPATQHSYEEQIFSSDNVKIKTTLLNSDHQDAIIYFGGNAEAVDYNAHHFAKIFPRQSVYLVKYRGYSGSEGIPTQKNLYQDALSIYDQLKPNYQTISVIGRSLGNGVATYLASKRSVERLVLITPFDSIENVAQQRIPYYPISILLKDKYNSIKRVKDIEAKTLILAASDDKIIPFHHTQLLFDHFLPSQAVMKIIKKTDHNSISNTKEYYLLLRGFL